MARHYCDVWCLITRGVAKRATQDRPLFDRVAAHREIFFRWSWTTPRSIPAYSDSCRPLRGEMSFGEVPTFSEILRVVGDFEKRFNQLSPA
jgi:hypothetical protein